MKLLRLAGAFIRRDFLVEVSYRASSFFRLAGALFAIWTFYFLSRTVGHGSPALAKYGGDYFTFALVGSSVSAVLSAALTQFARRIREAQVAGSLEALFAAPVAPGWIVIGSSLYSLLSSVVQAGLVLIGGAVLFGADFHRANIPATCVSLLFSVTAIGSLGLVSAAFVLVFKRGDPVAWAVDAASMLLSGVLFPVEVLPKPLQMLGQALPPTHALKALRANLLFGAGLAETWPSLAALAGFTLMGAVLAAVALPMALRRVEREGTLSHA